MEPRAQSNWFSDFWRHCCQLFRGGSAASGHILYFPEDSRASAFDDEEAQALKNTSPPGGWNGALDNVPWEDPRLDWPLLYEDGTPQRRGFYKYNTERRMLSIQRHEATMARIAATPLGRLCDAAIAGSVEGALAALAAGAAVNAPREMYCHEPPLSVAAMAGSVGVARLLLERGADVELRDTLGATPLSYAASGASVEMIELLLAAGAAVDAPDNGRWTPLFYAIGTGDEATVKALLRGGANVQGTGLRAPLYFAAGNNSDRLRRGGGRKAIPGIMQLLLDAGAEIDAVAPEDDGSALDAAVGHVELPVVQLLLSRGADPDTVSPHVIKRAEDGVGSPYRGSENAEILKLLREASKARAASRDPPATPAAEQQGDP